jgi:pimeloyl-ACP methyl ester carboxylesterase
MLNNRYLTAVSHRRILVSVLGRQVMARVAGRGPAILALHESPRSSHSLLPLIDALAHRYTVITLDTPGYGESDALEPDRPEAADFVAVIGGVLDALQLRKVLLYGTHTGAALAASFALAYPSRVSALVLDGFAAFDVEEQRDFTDRYLCPFEPSWDGSHLAELWSRVRDLYMWFPYHHRDAAHRLATELPSVSALYGTVRGFLASGSGYWRGYRCAGAIDAPAAARALRIPTLLTARPHDLIAAHLQRISATEYVQVKALGPSLAEWTQAIEAHFDGRDSDSATMPTGSGERVLMQLGHGAMHFRRRQGRGRPLIVIPDLPTGAIDELSHSEREHWVIDPPGCGYSDPLASEGACLDEWLKPVTRLLQELGIDSYEVTGSGFGAVFARCLADVDRRAELGVLQAEPIWSATLSPAPKERLLPKPWEDPDGGALFSSWYRLRDLRYYDDIEQGIPRLRRVSMVTEFNTQRLYDAHKGLWLAPESSDLIAVLQANCSK